MDNLFNPIRFNLVESLNWIVNFGWLIFVEPLVQSLHHIMANILPIIQIILSILLVAGILIQQNDAGLGSAFGGGDSGGGGAHTRRGAEKTIFNATIVIGILFVISAVLALFI